MGRVKRNICGNSESSRTETTAEFGPIGNSVLPVMLNSRSVSDRGELIAHWRLRAMSESEKKELKQRINRAARSIPSNSYRNLQVTLRAMSFLAPLVGIALLGTRRGNNDRSNEQPA